ncbi:SpoIIE family protein phosphatase [Streptomyces pactum]|uniref:SpoIIE family protein phosphatase n=1 Tax=Streptomyces pactum TaxID=68249 RepID=UPI000A70DCAD|nr:SpoIIE family protein phosphatase [Streptomyces pactum]
MGAIPTQRETVSRASGVPAPTAEAYAQECARTHVTLLGSSLAPGAARAMVRAALADWSELALPGTERLTEHLAADVLVVVSELVTNAVVHAGTDVEVACRLEETGTLVVEATDHHPSRAPRSGDHDETPHETPECGRGLRLVAALSEAWGITYRPGTKTVWARLPAAGAEVSEHIEAYAGGRGARRPEPAAGMELSGERSGGPTGLGDPIGPTNATNPSPTGPTNPSPTNPSPTNPSPTNPSPTGPTGPTGLGAPGAGSGPVALDGSGGTVALNGPGGLGDSMSLDGPGGTAALDGSGGLGDPMSLDGPGGHEDGDGPNAQGASSGPCGSGSPGGSGGPGGRGGRGGRGGAGAWDGWDGWGRRGDPDSGDHTDCRDRPEGRDHTDSRDRPEGRDHTDSRDRPESRTGQGGWDRFGGPAYWRGGTALTGRRGIRDREWLGHGALSFLAEASDLLAGQLDEGLVASLTGQLIVPRLADWCAVWLEDESLGRGAWSDDPGASVGARLARVWHSGESRIEELRLALEKDPPRPRDPWRSGPVAHPWPGEALGPDGTHGTALAYRLVAGGRPLGTLVIGRTAAPATAVAAETPDAAAATGVTPSAPPTTPDTQATPATQATPLTHDTPGFPEEITGLVEDLSRRVALAIGAARQYARQATISAVLQRGLLPGAVAEIPGVRSALVYEPCDKGGPSGDFYDLFPAGDGRWCFAVGDVQGKGPEAAVVIGLARPWLRLLAREEYDVPDVLDRLNQLLLDDATEAADAAARALVAVGGRPVAPGDGPQTRFLSLLYGELVPVGGGAVRCTLASAGHPLPLLLGPDGAVRAVAEPQTLLGVVEDATYTSETFELRSGDTLLCVTDGVTERRSGSRQFDDGDGLAAALAGCAGLDAGLVAERIRRLVHEFGPRPPEDDLALLVLQAE